MSALASAAGAETPPAGEVTAREETERRFVVCATREEARLKEARRDRPRGTEGAAARTDTTVDARENMVASSFVRKCARKWLAWSRDASENSARLTKRYVASCHTPNVPSVARFSRKGRPE